MIRRIAFLLGALFLLTLSAGAQTQPVKPQTSQSLDRLFSVMAMPELIQVMRQEGLQYGAELGQEMLPSPGRQWSSLLDKIYDSDAMLASAQMAFADSFGDADPTPLIEFFESETGKLFVTSELKARRMFLSAEIEDAARESFRLMDGLGNPRETAIGAYISANQLIEFNVAGAMNSNFAFYLGLVEGEVMAMTESEILADVWSQEEMIRQDTREWMYAFLLTAYEPLSIAQIEEYTSLSRTPAGQALNQALFDGFDRMYRDQSQALGLAIGASMLGQDL